MRKLNLVCILVLMHFLFSCSTVQCSPEEMKKKNFDTNVEVLKSQVLNMKTLKIYKSDGSAQCEPQSGVSLEKMSLELKDIKIFNSEKKHDGLMRTQVCGQMTGMCNVYEIPESEKERALSFGFKVWKGK